MKKLEFTLYPEWISYIIVIIGFIFSEFFNANAFYADFALILYSFYGVESLPNFYLQHIIYSLLSLGFLELMMILYLKLIKKISKNRIQVKNKEFKKIFRYFIFFRCLGLGVLNLTFYINPIFSVFGRMIFPMCALLIVGLFFTSYMKKIYFIKDYEKAIATKSFMIPLIIYSLVILLLEVIF